MERLTEYTGHGYIAYDPIDTKYDFSKINLQKLIDKLAHYEDLEEQGRLVELPEGYTVADLAYCTAYESCPKDLGLPLPFNCRMQSCKECWEQALKGGGQNG